MSTKLQAYILIAENYVSVLDRFGTPKYNCCNIIGRPQTCCKTIICSDPNDIAHTEWTGNNINNPLEEIISGWIPVRLFYGKKDGDIINLLYQDKLDKQVVIEAKIQNNHPLEDILYKATATFEGVHEMPFNGYKQDTKLIQYTSIITTHDQYAKSIEKTPIDPLNFNHNEGFKKLKLELSS